MRTRAPLGRGLCLLYYLLAAKPVSDVQFSDITERAEDRFKTGELRHFEQVSD